MDTNRPRLLGDACDRFLDVTRGNHHQVVQLVDHHDDVRHVDVRRILWCNTGRRRQLLGGNRLVVAGDVPVADLGEHVVAPFHLLDGPPERVGCFLRVGDRLREEMRELLVLAHFDLLRVDQDQPHLVGGGTHQQRGDDAVDPARLTGTSGACDQ